VDCYSSRNRETSAEARQNDRLFCVGSTIRLLSVEALYVSDGFCSKNKVQSVRLKKRNQDRLETALTFDNVKSTKRALVDEIVGR
jgi:hypothetical protein